MTMDECLLIERVWELLRTTVKRGRMLTSPDEVRDVLLFTLALRELEVFGVLLLDNRNRGLTHHHKGSEHPAGQRAKKPLCRGGPGGWQSAGDMAESQR